MAVADVEAVGTASVQVARSFLAEVGAPVGGR